MESDGEGDVSFLFAGTSICVSLLFVFVNWDDLARTLETNYSWACLFETVETELFPQW